MGETEQILALRKRLRESGEPGVLATVLATAGSSYRLPGARLLLSQTGQRAGSISGGCLEDDLLKRAFWLTANGPVIRRYDTTADGEIAPAYGLGCNGILHVLLERVENGEHPVLDLIEQVQQSRQPVTVVHSLDRPGERYPAEHAGENVFVETIAPPIRLLIFGAGYDAAPVSEVARFLGWDSLVFDGRSHYARSERFPYARSVRVWKPGDVLPEMDPWTVAILMTHSFAQDTEIVRTLASTPPAYIGILGPAKRTQKLLADAGLNEDHFGDALHGPVGLDIGADGPEQVALAIASEIQAFVNHRQGGPLRARQGSIHSLSELATAFCSR